MFELSVNQRKFLVLYVHGLKPRLFWPWCRFSSLGFTLWLLRTWTSLHLQARVPQNQLNLWNWRVMCTQKLCQPITPILNKGCSNLPESPWQVSYQPKSYPAQNWKERLNSLLVLAFLKLTQVLSGRVEQRNYIEPTVSSLKRMSTLFRKGPFELLRLHTHHWQSHIRDQLPIEPSRPWFPTFPAANRPNVTKNFYRELPAS